MASFNRMYTSSSSSVSTRRWEYEVFLSFRGEDTRNNFTDYLHRALLEKHIKVFKDDEKLKHGEEISEGLLKAIAESQIAVIVISKNFASSRWCLAELAKIMEYKRQNQIEVWPIFYHVDPSHVRNLKDSFAEAFDKHTNNPKVDNQKMETWRATLKEVGHMKGWHVQNDRPEAKEVKELSEELSRKLHPNFSNLYKDLIGMESRVQELKNLLYIGWDDVQCVGIYGMNGIGKTTLAKLIYERICSEFKSSCFLGEDEQDWKYGGVKVMDKRFISEKVLIVIDDVDKEKNSKILTKLEKVLREKNREGFGQGSRLILTSSDYQLITRFLDCKYGDHAFKVKKLNFIEALELFSLKAFKKHFPKENYLELSRDIVRYADGLPLAIEVFGSLLFGKPMDAWRTSLEMLKANLNVGILNKLKISFDGLDDISKKLFLDIACFFNGRSLYWLIPILESFGYFPRINIEVLRDKSLIKIKDENIWMHNLLVQMGQQIVKVEYRNRLWHYEDIIDALKKNISVDEIEVLEGIRLLLHGGDEEELNLEAFSKMHKLRMIEIIPEGLHLKDCFLRAIPQNPYPKDIINRSGKWPWHINLFKSILKDSYPLEFMPKRFEQCLGKLQWVGDHSKLMLSDKLYLMNWFQYPLHSLPITFQSKNLLELRLPCSSIKKLWSGSKSFGKLRVIHLNYSINLMETPDLTNVPNLEKLELSYCTSLFKVHSSIGALKQLKLLDLSGCKSLKNLPKNLGGMESLEELNISQTSLKQLPSSIGSLKKLKILKGRGNLSNPISFPFPRSISSVSSLEFLNLQYCNLSSEMIPQNLGSLSSLKRLFLDGNKFKRVPEFVWKLSKLENLGLSHCNLSDEGILNNISCLSLLRELDLHGNKFKTIADSISQLPKLDDLDLSDNKKLHSLPKLPCTLGSLWISNCPLLNTSMDKWSFGVPIRKSNFGVTYYGYDGKCHVIVHKGSEYPSPSHLLRKWVDVEMACGPTLGSEIPGWFGLRSNSTFEIQGSMKRNRIWDFKGLVLFIVYEVDRSSNYRGSEESSPANLEIACQVTSKRVGFESRVIEVPPVERTGIGCRRNGVWVFLPGKTLQKCLSNCGYSSDYDRSLEESVDFALSVSAIGPNIQEKEYGVRGVDSTDAKEWCQVLGDISFHGWAPKSFEDFYSRSFLTCS